jgi:Family of unknown function (DUF6118)
MLCRRAGRAGLRVDPRGDRQGAAGRRRTTGRDRGIAAVRATPAAVAQQMRQEAVRLTESQVAQARAAQEGFERGRETIACVAFVEQRAQHDRRIVWAVGGGAALVGAAFGAMLFMEINRHAPDSWGWSAGWAAWLMQTDMVQAGYKLIGRNDPSAITVVGEYIRLGNAYAGELYKCEATSAQIGKEQRCAFGVQPPRYR